MHCDWVVHTDLTGTEAKELVGEMDQYLTRSLTRAGRDNEMALALTVEEQQQLVNMLNVFKLKRLREQLRTFLTKEQLPDQVCANDEEWKKFQNLYIAVVDSCPLRVEDDTGLKTINKLILKTQSPFLISVTEEVPGIWEIHFKNGAVIPISGDLA